jgi:hypothetical protein
MRPVADCLPLLLASGQLLAEEIFNNQEEAGSAFNEFIGSRTSGSFQRGLQNLFITANIC